MSRDEVTVAVPWLVLGLAQLWLASAGFVHPTLAQQGLEVVGLAIFGLSLARFAPAGVARSPLLAGWFALGFTAWRLGPSGYQAGLLALGVIALGWALLRAAERLRPGLIAGMIGALVGIIGARALVLHHAHGSDGRLTGPSTAILPRIAHEAVFPLRPRAPAPTARTPSILLISVDTLRPDTAERMQTVGRLAKQGAYWPRAMANGSWTVPAMGALHTGLDAVDHGAGLAEDGSLQGLDAPTLAEALAAQGYTTAAFATNAWLMPGFGFERGFHHYRHADADTPPLMLLSGLPATPPPQDAAVVVDHAMRWLTHAPDTGSFVWVHLIDPHLPYLHAPAGSLAAEATDERLRAGMRLTPQKIQTLRAAYEAEVAYVDAALVRLLDRVDEVWPDAIIAFAADHGEELWDRGGTGHGHQHHTEVVDVPLLLRAPGLSRQRRTDLATLADLASTLAALGGASLGRGQDLREPIPAQRIVSIAGNAYFQPHRSARRGRHRAILAGPDAPPRCFQGEADPTEQHALPCPDDLAAAAAAARRPAPRADADAVLPKDALRELGYLVD